MLIKLNFQIKNELGHDIGYASKALVNSFKRLDLRDEHMIKKVDVFIDKLRDKGQVELDEADFDLFKNCLLSCDAMLMIKSPVLKILNRAKETNDKKEERKEALQNDSPKRKRK